MLLSDRKKESSSQTEEKDINCPSMCLNHFETYIYIYTYPSTLKKHRNTFATLILNPLETSAGEIPTDKLHIFKIVVFTNLKEAR